MSIEWNEVRNEVRQAGELEAAFGLARSQQRPLFLYWGAVWCPPCNRVKAEIFARDEFVRRSASVLCCHLDGDSPGAQALAARYGLRSYPTLVLFAPDGRRVISPRPCWRWCACATMPTRPRAWVCTHNWPPPAKASTRRPTPLV